MRLLALILVLCAAGCSAPTVPVFHPEGRPAALSEWGQLYREGDQLRLADGVQSYALNSPLFSDHAGKLRTLWMPADRTGNYSSTEIMAFPVGTVISKTFYYPLDAQGRVLRGDQPMSDPIALTALDVDRVRLVETRLLVHRKTGWEALPYVWNDDQMDARLVRTGYSETFTLADAGGRLRQIDYLVPNVNQCQGCHAVNNTTRMLQPIGPTARQLNRDLIYASKSSTAKSNQLTRLAHAGYLAGLPAPDEIPRAAAWHDANEPLEARARAYLDINCAHCHNPVGPADTSGLHLHWAAEVGPNLGLCKPPIAAGPGSGGHRFAIVPGSPDTSIISYRMASQQADVMMPELGRSLVHEEGVALIRDWIASLAGDCGLNGLSALGPSRPKRKSISVPGSKFRH